MPDVILDPGPANIRVTQDSAFSATFTFYSDAAMTVPIDTSSWSPTAATESGQAFTVDNSGGASGVIVISLTMAEVNALPAGVQHWALDRTDAGNERRMLAGTFEKTIYGP